MSNKVPLIGNLRSKIMQVAITNVKDMRYLVRLFDDNKVAIRINSLKEPTRIVIAIKGILNFKQKADVEGVVKEAVRLCKYDKEFIVDLRLI